MLPQETGDLGTRLPEYARVVGEQDEIVHIPNVAGDVQGFLDIVIIKMASQPVLATFTSFHENSVYFVLISFRVLAL